VWAVEEQASSAPQSVIWDPFLSPASTAPTSRRGAGLLVRALGVTVFDMLLSRNRPTLADRRTAVGWHRRQGIQAVNENLSQSHHEVMQRIERDLIDSYDEELEMEIDDRRIEGGLEEDHSPQGQLDRQAYFRELLRLQGELVKLQDWVQSTGQKVVVLFEGRDAAGKGGVIKRITQRLNPRVCRVAALPAPNDRERTQWYFQRYVSHLPAAGEIVLFDRSWYNRAGVERVMGFCDDAQYEEFFRSVPEFEKMLVRSGITLVKYWFSITDEEQHVRFLGRIHDPLKQWKLSPMDFESRRRWEAYTKAKEIMLERTHIPEAPWWLVQAVDKKKARLNCISHLLTQLPYEEVEHPAIVLPARTRNPEYTRNPVPAEMYVPETY
jgi:polyphosphate kinase 2